jgi:hypothetical protein
MSLRTKNFFLGAEIEAYINLEATELVPSFGGLRYWRVCVMWRNKGVRSKNFNGVNVARVGVLTRIIQLTCNR